MELVEINESQPMFLIKCKKDKTEKTAHNI